MLFLKRTNDVASPTIIEKTANIWKRSLYSLIDSDFKLIFSYSSLIGGIYFCRRAGFKILRMEKRESVIQIK